MAQAIWTGSISFGLVNVPVRLYPATRKKDVRFHELDRVTGRRVRHQRVRFEPSALIPPLTAFPVDGGGEGFRAALPLARAELPEPSPRAQVAREELIRGFEVAPEQYITVSEDELQSLAPEATRTIDVEQFADVSEVDSIYFDSSYYVVPTVEGARAYALLLDAMTETNRLAIGWFTLRRKRHLASVRAFRGVMLLSTMLHGDEVLDAPGVPWVDGNKLSERETQMAKLLVDTLSGPFEPEQYRDEYRERVLKLIRGKTSSPLGADVQVGLASGQPTPVQDLMAALQASIQAATATRTDEDGHSRRERRSRAK